MNVRPVFGPFNRIVSTETAGAVLLRSLLNSPVLPSQSCTIILSRRNFAPSSPPSPGPPFTWKSHISPVFVARTTNTGFHPDGFGRPTNTCARCNNEPETSDRRNRTRTLCVINRGKGCFKSPVRGAPVMDG